MPSSGKLSRVALGRTDVSEKRISSIIKATTIGELGTKLAVASNRSTLRRIMEAILSSKMSVLTRATQRHIPEESNLHFLSYNIHLRRPAWLFCYDMLSLRRLCCVFGERGPMFINVTLLSPLLCVLLMCSVYFCFWIQVLIIGVCVNEFDISIALPRLLGFSIQNTINEQDYWRTVSSGMLRRVALVRTDVSEELTASFFRVTRLGISSQLASVASYS
jgi:hypothetical protein